jgi:hypothetical protein
MLPRANDSEQIAFNKQLRSSMQRQASADAPPTQQQRAHSDRRRARMMAREADLPASRAEAFSKRLHCPI